MRTRQQPSRGPHRPMPSHALLPPDTHPHASALPPRCPTPFRAMPSCPGITLHGNAPLSLPGRRAHAEARTGTQTGAQAGAGPALRQYAAEQKIPPRIHAGKQQPPLPSPNTHIRPTARHLVPRLLATRHRPPTPFRPETRIHAGKQPRHLTSRHTVPQQYAAEQKIPPRILAGKRRPAPPPDSSPPNSPQRIPVGKQPPPLSFPGTHPHTQPPRNTHPSGDAHPTQDTHPPPPPRRSAATCRRPPPHRSAPPDARAHKKAKHPCGCFASLWKRGVRYSPRAKRL